MQDAALAAHRFGFAEPDLAPWRADPRGWVLAQFDHPAPFDGSGLISGALAGAMTREIVRQALKEKPAANAPPGASGGQEIRAADSAVSPVQAERRRLRDADIAGLQRRWQQVVATPTPVYERWVMFWSNHFCVSATKGATRALVWPHEREAIRPQARARFVDMLRASTLHPAMVLFLDNAQSLGPDSRAAMRRASASGVRRGLNENLARELMELHTVGVHGGYTQNDVTEVARILTGWSLAPDESEGMRVVFRPALHEPGRKLVMGRWYPEGPDAIEQLFVDLSRHPSTAPYIAGKLARHFVADDPPPALVAQLAERFRSSDGDLLAMARLLFGSNLAWRGNGRPKFKRPEELVLSSFRLLGAPIPQPPGQVLKLGVALSDMGQPPGRAPSPQGWPDRQEDWLAPDSLWKRLEWASSFSSAHAGTVDARALALASFGTDLSPQVREQLARAATGAQALALLIGSPEFQRR